MNKLISGLPKRFIVRNLSKTKPVVWHFAIFTQEPSLHVNFWDPYYYLSFIQAPEEHS